MEKSFWLGRKNHITLQKAMFFLKLFNELPLWPDMAPSGLIFTSRQQRLLPARFRHDDFHQPCSSEVG
jgi:hypothetical protein